MHKYLTTAACLLVSSLAFSQLAEPLMFKEKIHDFGTISEEAGPAETEFIFTNNSGRTIRILSVKASCGCTTSGWTKEPIRSGGEAFVKATFDPRGRPGYFNKTLSVTTDLTNTPVVLQIKGQVVSKEMEQDISRLEESLGALKVQSSSLNLGKIYINKPSTPFRFKVFNNGQQPVRILSAIAPDYLRVSAPESVAVGASAFVEVLFDAKLKNQYGFLSESIELLTDDEELPRKHFSVYATVEEYFNVPSKDELTKVPSLKMEVAQVEFNHVKIGALATRSIVIRNAGKEELVIRSLQPNCSCITTDLESQSIQPGAQTQLTIRFTGAGRRGTQNKAITVYSNDPVNPVQRLLILAVVD